MSKMTASELVEKAINVAKNVKNVYALGMFGQIITEDIIQQKKNQLPAWYTDSKVTALRKLTGQGCYGFDCVCFIKALLWGWTTSTPAKYASNDVPDYGSDDASVLTEISTDFNNILPGEQLCMTGHVGIYVGNGLAVECTPSWSNGVQITAVANISSKGGYNSRKWTKYGKIKYVDYSILPATTCAIDTDKIKAFQTWINNYLPIKYLGAKLDVDGKYGSLSRKAAIKAYQYWLNSTYSAGLAVDGGFGPLTKAKAPLLVKGNTGPGVYILQGLLYSKGYDPNGFDGSFGASGGTGCYNAVIAYQTDAGIEVDGKAGGETFSKLFNG